MSEDSLRNFQITSLTEFFLSLPHLTLYLICLYIWLKLSKSHEFFSVNLSPQNFLHQLTHSLTLDDLAKILYLICTQLFWRKKDLNDSLRTPIYYTLYFLYLSHTHHIRTHTNFFCVNVYKRSHQIFELQ